MLRTEQFENVALIDEPHFSPQFLGSAGSAENAERGGKQTTLPIKKAGQNPTFYTRLSGTASTSVVSGQKRIF
ncbi:hypothetical protein FA04_33985 (plasmid) [Ensifer adhaerens]|nr:hypothetical protein FA04_33985 [Ensifer adhaerens]KDP72540.1 hypothetical protein FA04_17060 [Ensifer adhaerens]